MTSWRNLSSSLFCEKVYSIGRPLLIFKRLDVSRHDLVSASSEAHRISLSERQYPWRFCVSTRMFTQRVKAVWSCLGLMFSTPWPILSALYLHS